MTDRDCVKAGCPAAGKGALPCSRIEGCPAKEAELKNRQIQGDAPNTKEGEKP